MLAYARSVSPVSYLGRAKAPTRLVQGQSDSPFNLNEATAPYKTLKARGTTTRMTWQSWGHSGGQVPGELNLSEGNLESGYVGQRVLAWFDRYLQKEHTDTGPPTHLRTGRGSVHRHSNGAISLFTGDIGKQKMPMTYTVVRGGGVIAASYGVNMLDPNHAALPEAVVKAQLDRL